jgi:Bacterial mobilisation protein (MobC)
MGRNGSLRSPLDERTEDDTRANEGATHAAASPATPSAEVKTPSSEPETVPIRRKRSRRDRASNPFLKTVQVVAYMTRDERTRIGTRAKAKGLGISPYMVRSALGQRLPAARPPAPPIPEVNRATYFQLAQIGNNLNQLARWANIGGGEEPTAHEVLETLDALIPVVRKVQLDVIGTHDGARKAQ